jgi:hypothetical protein
MCKSNGRGRRRCSRLYPRESCQRNKKMIEVNSPSSLRPQQTMRMHGNILPPEMTHPTPQHKFNTMASRQVTAGLRAPHAWLSHDLSHVICKSAAPICSISFPCAFHILLLPQRVHRAYPCCLHHLAPRSHITPATEPPCTICNLVFSWLHPCV